MLARYAFPLAFSALALAGCQTSRPVVATAARAGLAADSAAAVVLIHSSQGPEPMQAVVTAAEARELSAARAAAKQR